MANLTYDAKSFLIDGRRFWMLAAGVQYSRVPRASWRRIILAARQAGFNTIESCCPWIVHEPRRGRFNFEGENNLRQFAQLCGELGMKLFLRIGPYVGAGFDGGGLPAWLLQTPGLVVREGNEQFLERVNSYFQHLLKQVADLQCSHGVGSGGPLIAVQTEHDWQCANDGEGNRYLRELTRNVRENGITVPILNANDLWQDTPQTIETWRGWEQLLEHLRQLRMLHPIHPVIVSEFNPARIVTWGQSLRGLQNRTAGQVIHRAAQVLAGGGQLVVHPFHGGSNFAATGGRLSGRPDGYITQAAYAGSPMGEAGVRSEKYHYLRRVVMFASHFSHVFGEHDYDHQTTVLDVSEFESDSPDGKSRAGSQSGGSRLSIVPLRGSAGEVIFVFAGDDVNDAAGTLLLDNGLRLPVALGDQPVGWYLLDVDLRGAGRLDYCNLCPFAIVGRSTLVLHGPAGSRAYLSVDGTPLEATVPTGQKPVVLHARGVTVVICSRRQIDATYFKDDTVYVGVAGPPGGLEETESRDEATDGTNKPPAHPDFTRMTVIAADGESKTYASRPADTGARTSNRGRSRRSTRRVSLRSWIAGPNADYVDGTCPRFATLDGPQTLAACGASVGYGWYRLRVTSKSAKKRRVLLPESGDRVHLFVNGESAGIFGFGPGADHRPLNLKLARGENVLAMLIDNLGRFTDGNDLDDRKGLYGHIYEVKPLARIKPVVEDAAPVHPFELRGYLAGRTFGQLSNRQQVIWRFSHARVSPLLLEIDGVAASGTIVLNDKPIHYYSGATGAAFMRLRLDPKELESFKRGKNELRFAPDPDQGDCHDELIKKSTLYECVEAISAGPPEVSWAFAKWEPPMKQQWREVSKTGARALRGVPCWWHCRFRLPAGSAKRGVSGAGQDGRAQSILDSAGQFAGWWFDTSGLSKGQIFVNNHHLGRYFTSTATGKQVGPQRRLHLPIDWLRLDEENDLLVFDEHGFDPFKTSLTLSDAGDLD